MTRLLSCVGGYVDESADGGTVQAVDAYQNVSRNLHGPSARLMLTEYVKQHPNHEYINAIRHLIENCAGIVTT